MAAKTKIVVPTVLVGIGAVGLVASAIWLVVLGLRADAGASPPAWDGWAQLAIAAVVLVAGLVWLLALVIAEQRRRGRSWAIRGRVAAPPPDQDSCPRSTLPVSPRREN